MKVKTKHSARMLTLAAITGALIVLSGCASTDRMDRMQAQIDAMKSDIAATRSDASAMSAKANDAAGSAVNTANSAANIANEANRRSIETEAKIDRMFKKAMHK